MTDRNETLADIVSEMRRSVTEHYANQTLPSPCEVGIYANRIEEAWGRQTIMHAEAENELLSGGTKLVGNTAKLRDALEKLLDYWARCDVTYPPERRLRDMAQAALPAPPRNCDRFANAEAAYKAFEDYCFKRPSQNKCVGCVVIDDGGKCGCFGAWLLAQAAQEGGK